MVNLFKRNRSIIVFLTLILISFVFMSQKKETSKLQKFVKEVVYTIVQPITFITSQVWGTITDSFKNITNYSDRIGKLEKLIKKYNYKTLIDIEALIKENIELKRQLGYKNDIVSKQFTIETEFAQIIARSPESFYQSLIIDKGRNYGILQEMPVITFQNVFLKQQKKKDIMAVVVGKVSQSTISSAKILPLIEKGCNISAKLIESNCSGILEGCGLYEKGPILNYINVDAKVKVGDILVTAGGQSLFPQGILIGEVTKVFKEEAEFFQKAYIKPFIDLNNIDYVFVIKAQLDEELKKLLIYSK